MVFFNDVANECLPEGPRICSVWHLQGQSRGKAHVFQHTESPVPREIMILKLVRSGIMWALLSLCTPK